MYESDEARHQIQRERFRRFRFRFRLVGCGSRLGRVEGGNDDGLSFRSCFVLIVAGLE